MAKALKLKNGKGALISQVISNSPAENSGIKNKDVIISVDGKKINDSSQLKNLISNGRPNDKTMLTIIRDGGEKDIMVTLGLRPNQNELSNVYQYGNEAYDILGLTVKDNTSNQNDSSSPNGVIVNAIKQNSPASENNIQKKDIIISIGKSKISNINDYKSELEKYDIDDTIMLRILRDKNPFYLAFEIN
jgi:serine protease Do